MDCLGHTEHGGNNLYFGIYVLSSTSWEAQINSSLGCQFPANQCPFQMLLGCRYGGIIDKPHVSKAWGIYWQTLLTGPSYI